MLKPPCVLRATTQLGTFPVLVFVIPSVSPVPAQGLPWLCEPEAPILIPVPVPQWNSRNLALAPPSVGHSGGLPMLAACTELWFLCDLSPLSNPIEVFQLRS